MKKALKIIGIVLGSLLLLFLILAIANKINEGRINKYIDSFSAVEKSGTLAPHTDSDGSYYFVTDNSFKTLHITDVHLGGGIFSAKKDKMAINALAAMISTESPDLVVVTGDISFAVPFISGTMNNAYAHRMFQRIMEKLGVYYTVTLGNHDSEAYNYHNRKWVSESYSSADLKHCLFTPDGDVSGEGNHKINVKNSLGLITESFYMIDTHSYTDKDPLGLKWDYDHVKDDQIKWYSDSVLAARAHNASIYSTLTDEQKAEYGDLLEPKSLMFFHIPLREVKAAYDEYVNNNRQNSANTTYMGGNDGESDEVVYCSRTDELLFETILELGSTQALFYGHDHLNNFVLEHRGVILSYGYSIDYLAYFGISKQGYQRGCTVIICSPHGNAEIKHENYYQDKYESLYEKELVNMDKEAK